MAAPAWASTGTYFENSSSAPAFAVPSGVASGDVIVIPMYLDGTTTITAMASGFAHATGSPSGLSVGGGSHSVNVVWKRATGADSGTYTFTLSGSTFVCGSALRFTSAVASGDPWDVTNAAQDAANSTVTPAVSVTTTGPDRLLVFAGSCWAGGTWTAPGGFAERVDSGFGLITADDKAQAAAGSSGSVSATCTGSDKRCAWLGALIGTTTTGSRAPAPVVASQAVIRSATW